MFTTIQPHQHDAKKHLLDAGFRLRKTVFLDELNWAVTAEDGREIDEYDRAGQATYLVWCNPDETRLYGIVRLMPTSGPTLVNDVFAATHAANPIPRRDDVWEGTRLCIDRALLAEDWPGLGPCEAMCLMLLAVCEAAIDHGITRMVSNFEPATGRLYRRAGTDCTLHGKADGYGRRPVHCASFEVNEHVLAEMRAAQGVKTPIVTKSDGFYPIIPRRTPATPMPIPADLCESAHIAAAQMQVA